MGQATCQTHGTHPGMLCCEHVAEAAYGRAVLLPNASLSFSFDILEDGRDLLSCLICRECASRFDIPEDAILPGQTMDLPNAYPYIFPVCHYCVQDWRGPKCVLNADA